MNLNSKLGLRKASSRAESETSAAISRIQNNGATAAPKSVRENWVG